MCACVAVYIFRWRVAKRPGLDEFLKEMAQLYEIVVFTDSFGGLADEVRFEARARVKCQNGCVVFCCLVLLSRACCT